MFIRARIVLLGGALVAACGGAPAAPPPAPEAESPAPAVADECLAPSPGDPSATVTLGLATPVEPAHAPLPRSDAERLVFGQLYETLVVVDCAGRIRPGLAESWAADSTRQSWTFTLRDGARFWDGMPAGAAAVIESWRSTEPGRIISAVALDARRLTVTFPAGDEAGPLALADPALAVARHGAGWPVGTGRYRPEPESGTLVSDGPMPRLALRHPIASSAAPPRNDSADPRDALATGADLVVTRDRAAVEYAAARAELRAVPLAWDRTYLLLAQPGAPWPADSGLGARLARDAVRAESRAAAPPFWWDSVACDRPPMPRLSSPPRDRVVFPRDDATAADLAGRLVALAGRRLTAVGLDQRDLAAAIRSGADRGYVVAVPRHPTAACAVTAGWPIELAATPLVETRAHAIVRASVPSFTRTGDGSLRFVADSAAP